MALSRKNSNAEPCHWFVPDCVTMVTWPPGFLPYSAPYVSRRMLNSLTESMPISCPLAPPGVMLFSAAPVNSTPFSRKRFCCGRLPETANMLAVVELEIPIPPVFSHVKFTTPGFSSTSKS